MAATIIGHETKLRVREEENLTALVGPAREHWMHAIVRDLGLASSLQ